MAHHTHTIDALEEWEVIQAGINQDYFSLDSIINDTSSSLQAKQVNTTNDNSLPLYRYREPEQLRDRRLLQPDSEHESSETEGDAIISDQEANSVADQEETGTKKPWPVVWWKSQLDNLLRSFSVVGMRYCKPFWCMSVVVTMVCLVVLKKKIFGMKHKQRTVTTGRKFFSIAKTLSMHSGYDFIQQETQFAAAGTVQLNQTLSVVRHIPVIKIIPPVADANPWAIVHVK